MRVLLLVLMLLGVFGLTRGQVLFEYRELDLTGTIAGYRWHVDYPPLFNFCGFQPPRDALLVRLDPPSVVENFGAEFALIESPKRFTDGKRFADGEWKKFRVMRWVGCDRIIERWEIKTTKSFEKVKLPFGKFLSCYISMKDING